MAVAAGRGAVKPEVAEATMPGELLSPVARAPAFVEANTGLPISAPEIVVRDGDSDTRPTSPYVTEY